MNEKGEVIEQKKLPSNGEIVDFLKEFGERMEVTIHATKMIGQPQPERHSVAMKPGRDE